MQTSWVYRFLVLRFCLFQCFCCIFKLYQLARSTEEHLLKERQNNFQSYSLPKLRLWLEDISQKSLRKENCRRNFALTVTLSECQTHSQAFSCAWHRLRGLALFYDWRIWMTVCFVIGSNNNYFMFGSRKNSTYSCCLHVSTVQF